MGAWGGGGEPSGVDEAVRSVGGEERKVVFEATRVAVAAGVTNVHPIEGDAYRRLLGDPPGENRPLADQLPLDLPLSITPFDNRIRRVRSDKDSA